MPVPWAALGGSATSVSRPAPSVRGRRWAGGPSPGSQHAMPPTVPAQRCFTGSGTEYRGVASTAASGLSCLAWNSDLLYQELHVDSVDAAALLGLGPHAYCRSALAQPAPGRLLRGGQGRPGGRPPSLAGPGLLTPLPGWGKPGQGSGPQGPRPPCPPAGPAPSLCEGPYHSPHLPPPPRNPDQDEKPWCYVLKDQALSWEYCRLAPCGACSWWPTSRRGRSAAPCGPPHPRPVPSLENLCPSERRGG